ncbi:MAG: hypothetical protein KDA93_18475 [Planctomycetaceae bacterium]|nr:hypothetical protein [Planctomycetaceae bacterium]
MTRRHSFASALTIAVLVGQTWLSSGSAHAIDNDPVAADLVDLALAIPEAVTAIEDADTALKRIARMEQEKLIDKKEGEKYRVQKRLASRRLELLRFLLDAELEATEMRLGFLKARQKDLGIDAPVRITAAEQRRHVLTLLKEASHVSEENADDTTLKQPQNSTTVTGIVRVVGEVPDLPDLSTKRFVRSMRQAERGEAGQPWPSPCGADSIPDESLLVGPDGGLANAFVYLKETPDDIHAPIPEEIALVTAHNCRFEPRCSIVRVGQKVQCNNLERDVVPFRIRPFENSPWLEVVAPRDDVGFTFEYTRREPIPFFIRSDFHSWMSACRLVVDHPFAALTDEGGRFQINGLPEGEHDFRVWHERVGYLEKALKITVGESEPTEVEVTVKAERLIEDKRKNLP